MTMLRNITGVLLLATALAATADSAGEPFPDTGEPRSWEFRVMLDQRPIGFHRFDLRERGDRAVVDIEAEFEVEVFFVTAYRYEHDNRETWQDDCLVQIESATDDNGKRYRVAGTAAGEEIFELKRNDEATRVEAGCVQSFAYWNPSILDAERLLNAQTGEIKDVTVERIGVTPFDIDGVAVNSEEYLLTMDDGAIRLWYEQDSGQWLGLETRTRGDRLLRYEPASLPEPPAGTALARAGAAGTAARLSPP